MITGEAVVEDGTWKVAAPTFCAVINASTRGRIVCDASRFL